MKATEQYFPVVLSIYAVQGGSNFEFMYGMSRDLKLVKAITCNLHVLRLLCSALYTFEQENS